MKNHKRIFILIFLLLPPFVFGQTKTNLNIFKELVDSSVTSFVNNLPKNENQINLKLELGVSYSFFKNRILNDLTLKGIKVTVYPSFKENAAKINYAVEEMNVDYSEIDRDGMFGDFLMPRKLSLKGSYSIDKKNIFTKNFNYTFLDTVNVKAVKSLENESYPFTKGEVPTEPFFSSITEPVIAIGSAALAVILFFTIRSK
ncbi:MAG TPA: hypothetical protein ENI57_03110 [Ignavibacteria bacterium]|nr:hypothetical protein [Ignavibacteria bacterium]